MTRQGLSRFFCVIAVRLTLLLLLTTLTLVAAQDNGTASTSDCNICGEGNMILSPRGVVEFDYYNETLKNSCQEWQVVVVNPNAISELFCKNEMIKYTAGPCKCTTQSGKLLTDLMRQNQTKKDDGVNDATENSEPSGSSTSKAAFLDIVLSVVVSCSSIVGIMML